jgi:hypothetical protein
LLHTAIVEHLSAVGCPLMLTNSDDVPFMPAGHQHFQHLLGYTIARIRPRVRVEPRSALGDLRRPIVVISAAILAFVRTQRATR